MIESEERKQRIENTIENWAIHCLLKPHLREGDIRNLVGQIMDEFYHVTLSCGHQVMNINEGVLISFKDVDHEGKECEVQGNYCKDCAEKYKKELGSKEIKSDTVPEGSTCHYERIDGKWYVVWGADFPQDNSGRKEVDWKEAFLLECGYLEAKSEKD